MIKSRKISFIVALFVTAILCFFAPLAINNNFAVASNTVELSISGQTLSLKDNIHIKYAVDANGVGESDTLKLLVWTEPQQDYVKGTENTLLSSTDTVEKDEKTLKVFEYDKLSARQMTDKVYARAYAVVNDVEYYSEVKPYSILEYAYNKLDKTEATPTDDENLITLLNAMLEFGGAAQVYNNYALDRLANAEYSYVRIENATFSDGFNYGIFKVGSTEVLTPNNYYILTEACVDYFSKNENGEIILTVPVEKTIDATSIIRKYSGYVNFNKNSDNLSYSVVGVKDYYSSNLVIPSTYNGLPVTSISNWAFASCSSLTSVTIPDSVTSIGEFAFYECSSLTSIEIPDSVTSIGDEAFSWCSSLTNVIIPDSVEYMGSYIFYFCFSLEVINCCALEQPYGWDSTWNYLSDDWSDEYCDYIPVYIDVVWGSEIKEESSDFEFELINNDTEYKLTTYIGNNSTITIPSTHKNLPVTSIGEDAFHDCDSLTSIEIPDSVTSIGVSAFQSCSSLTSVTIGNGVTCIGNYAFQSCSSLTSVIIPDNVTYIGYGAFRYCSLLQDVSIGDNVSFIDEYAFEECKYTTRGNVNYLGDKIIVGVENKSSSTYTICEGTKYICAYAFKNCSSLTSISIPDSVVFIGDSAFFSCSSLKSVRMSSNISSVDIYAFSMCNSLQYNEKDGLKYLGNENNAYVYLADADSSLNTLSIDSSCRVIGPSALAYLKSLTSATIPNSVVYIARWAFEGCNALTSLSIGANVSGIGFDAFSNCNSLNNITVSSQNKTYHSYNNCIIETQTNTLILCKNSQIPSYVTAIGNCAFQGYNLSTSIVISENVTVIEESAFRVASLTTIYCEAESKPDGWDDEWNYACSAEVVWGY